MSPRSAGPLVASSLLCLAVAAETSPTTAPSPYRPLSPYDRAVIERVRARAAARLRSPECVRVLGEFTDGEGRPLESNLSEGTTASAYLGEIDFVDGSRLRGCRRREAVMTTVPGVARVYVCPASGRQTSRLAGVEFGGGSLAEAMVIHEMLHTLGLGENPPSGSEITARVRQRCR